MQYFVLRARHFSRMDFGGKNYKKILEKNCLCFCFMIRIRFPMSPTPSLFRARVFFQKKNSIFSSLKVPSLNAWVSVYTGSNSMNKEHKNTTDK